MAGIMGRVRSLVYYMFDGEEAVGPPLPWDQGGVVAGWAMQYLSRLAWRTRREMELDDLLQEAYLVYLRVCDEVVENASPAEFMALFKAALHNQVVTMGCSVRARLRSRTRSMSARDERVASTGDVDQVEWGWRLQEAPKDVQSLVYAVEGRTRRLKRRHRIRYDGRQGRETTNEYLCRLAKLPADTPLRAQFESWLGFPF